MKRAAIFGIVVVVIASAWTYLAAQSSPRSPEVPFVEPSPPTAQTPKLAPLPAEPALTPLQQRYVELAAKKARLMTEEQLQQSVNELDRDVEELRAWSKVDESARALREVIEKHPQSRAAATARSAIRIIDHGRSSNVPDSDMTPRPDPGVPRADKPFGAGPTPAPDEKSERNQPFGAPDTEAIPSREPKV
jgi:hypothetical protein